MRTRSESLLKDPMLLLVVLAMLLGVIGMGSTANAHAARTIVVASAMR